MEKYLPKFFLARPYLWSVVAVALIGGGAFAYSAATRSPEYDTATAVRKDIRQEVRVTGKVKAAKEINLAFEKTGKVASVAVRVGQKVSPGQLLASLENHDALARVAEAEAAVRLQEARLAEIKSGTRPEDLAISQTKVQAAERSLVDAEQDLADTAEEAYTKSDDAVRNSIDQLFLNSQTSEPPYKYLGANPQLEISIESERNTVDVLLKKWETEGATGDPEKNLQTVKTFVDKVASLTNTFSATPPYTQATVDGWKADLASARTSINTAISNLSTAREEVAEAKSDLEIAKQELSLDAAGATPEAVRVQEAQVLQAKAGLEVAEAELSKTMISAPIAGTVIKRNIEPGEITQAQSATLALISESDVEIEANVAEADITKLEVGQTAAITLDAYGSDEVFSGKVVQIDPAETIVDGIPTYPTKIQFTKKDPRIKPGLTANINVLTAERKGVVTVPTRAIVQKNGNKIVKVLEGETIKEVKVETGLKGSDGTTEIVSGVEEGNTLIVGE